VAIRVSRPIVTEAGQVTISRKSDVSARHLAYRHSMAAHLTKLAWLN